MSVGIDLFLAQLQAMPSHISVKAEVLLEASDGKPDLRRTWTQASR